MSGTGRGKGGKGL
ncbi:hypothetical protein G210_2811, partial [Candida maltosa Xu316]